MRRRRMTAALALLAALAAILVILAVAVARPAGTAGVARAMTLDGNPVALALDSRTGRAFVALAGAGSGAHGRVFVLDSKTGALWRTITVGHALSALAVDERAGRVFVADDLDPAGSYSGRAGALYAIDERGGRVDHVLTLDARASALALDGRTGHVLTVTRDSAAGGASFGGGVAVRDAATGTILHSGVAGMFPTAIAVDAGTARAFVSNLLSNSVSVLDAGTARTLGTVTLGPPPGRVAAVAVDARTRRVFALSLPPLIAGGPQPARGSVAMIDVATGRLLRQMAVRNPSALAVDARNGHLIVGARDSLLVLDGATGRQLRTIAVPGAAPQALAVDARTGHAVLTRWSSAVRDADPWGWLPGPLRGALPFIPAPPQRFHDAPASVSVLDLTR